MEKLEAATPQEPDADEDRKKLLSEFFAGLWTRWRTYDASP